MITWNRPMMGHLNSFSALGGGNLNQNFPKIQMPGGLPGRGGGKLKLRFDWYIRVLSSKPCLHTQLLKHNRSYGKVSRGWRMAVLQFLISLWKEGEKKKKKSYCNAGYSYLVTHPSTNSAEQGLTLLKRRNMLLSLWYGDSTVNAF